MKHIIPSIVIALLALALPTQARAQPERYELGRRLGAFELAWDKNTDPVARKQATNAIWNVPLLTFMGQLDEAGRLFDLGRHALLADKDVSPETLWAESLFLTPVTRLVDASELELPFTLREFYRPKASLPKDAQLGLALFAGKNELTPIKQVPMEGKWPLQKRGEGDHLVHQTIRVGDKVVAQSMFKLSVVKDLKPRMHKLKQAVDGFAKKSGGIDVLTVRETFNLLTALAGRETMETDYPAARLLAEAEAAALSIQAGKTYFGGDKTGQFWLRLPSGPSSAIAVRLQAPDSIKEKKPLPLVIAMHGLGGSENMFFEAYGSGLIAKLCRERGWLLVSPRSFLGAGHSIATMIDEVNKLYPVDKTKVFIVGHSLGALQALVAAQDQPNLFAGVAMLGSGGAVKAKADLRKTPFFVSVGTADLAHLGARALADRLKKAGAKSVDYREFKDLEHLTVVRESLPDVFAFFENAAKANQ